MSEDVHARAGHLIAQERVEGILQRSGNGWISICKSASAARGRPGRRRKR